MMSLPRVAEVMRLTRGLHTQLLELVTEDTDANEAASAVFSLALSILLAAVEQGADVEAFREPLARLYGALPPIAQTTVN